MKKLNKKVTLWDIVDKAFDIQSELIAGNMIVIIIHIITLVLVPIHYIFGKLYPELMIFIIIKTYLRVYISVMLTAIIVPFILYAIELKCNKKVKDTEGESED